MISKQPFNQQQLTTYASPSYLSVCLYVCLYVCLFVSPFYAASLAFSARNSEPPLFINKCVHLSSTLIHNQCCVVD